MDQRASTMSYYLLVIIVYNWWLTYVSCFIYLLNSGAREWISEHPGISSSIMCVIINIMQSYIINIVVKNIIDIIISIIIRVNGSTSILVAYNTTNDAT